MKWDRRSRLMAVGAIGMLLILFGVVQAIFKFKINEKLINEITLFLMIIAFGFYFGGRKKKEPSAEADPAPANPSDELEQKKEDNNS